MPWWGWLVIAALAAILVTLVSFLLWFIHRLFNWDKW
jgi:hypothetical protein